MIKRNEIANIQIFYYICKKNYPASRDLSHHCLIFYRVNNQNDRLKYMILSVKNISKKFGFIQAVNNLSFNVEKGSIFGILGPNGSGKTTTLGIILNAVNQDKGTYLWFDRQASKENLKKTGAILEKPLFYPYLSGTQNLKIIAHIKEISYDNIENVLKTVGLYDRKDCKFKTYSLGMKQRLAIASALLCNPEVLILDEPTNGLDPQGIADIRNLIKYNGSKGTTIILASHLLDEVQKVCTHVAILKKGKLLFSGKVDEMLKSEKIIEISAEDIESLYKIMKNHPKVKSIDKENNLLIITLSEDINTADLNNYLLNKGITLSHLSIKKKNLEKQFLEMLV